MLVYKLFRKQLFTKGDDMASFMPTSTYQRRIPIIYSGSLDIRFGDLDSYNHVNAKRYLDYVASSRLKFLEREMKVSVHDLVSKCVGFYLRKANQIFKRPIIDLCTVYSTSYVEGIQGPNLVIPHKIHSKESDIFSEGVLEYTLVDLKTGKPKIPDMWIADLFFE